MTESTAITVNFNVHMSDRVTVTDSVPGCEPNVRDELYLTFQSLLVRDRELYESHYDC